MLLQPLTILCTILCPSLPKHMVIHLRGTARSVHFISNYPLIRLTLKHTLKASPSPVNSISRSCQFHKSIKILSDLTSSYHCKCGRCTANTIAEAHLSGTIEGRLDCFTLVDVETKAISSNTSSLEGLRSSESLGCRTVR